MSNELTTDVVGQPSTGMTEVAASRQSQEVQAMMVVAKKFPRDETRAVAAIIKSCSRKGLAECAMYSYPKGGKRVTGPSIRLAEVMARCWGNLDFGITELDQVEGESTMMAYAWDMETNVRQTKIFTVKHMRDTKDGGVALHGSRDIYEITANMGARRMRACILGVIPGDIQDEAIAQCELTLKGKSEEPLEDRVRKMAARFMEVGVSLEMLEERLQHPLGACDIHTIVELGKIYNSIKEGIGKREDFFAIPSVTSSDKPGGKTEQLAADMEKKSRKKTPAKKKTEKPKPEATPVSESFSLYEAKLACATTEAAVRQVWSEDIFDQKDKLSPEEYGRGCELRDQHVKRVAPPVQGELLS